MTYDPKDPRLTAYALGELNEDGLKSMEQMLQQSEELQQEIKDIKSVTDFFTEHF